MTLQQAKEQILTYIKQFETDAAVGLPVDRRRRSLLRRLNDYKLAKQAYIELLQEREIHETGRGFGNQPVITVIGRGPDPKLQVSQIYRNVPEKVLLAFLTRMVLDYPDIEPSEHVTKALESYLPESQY